MNRALAREIVDCLSVSGSPKDHMAGLAGLGQRQWERILNWLDLSGLALLFWNRLKELASESVVPPAVRARLARNLRDHRLRIADMAGEFDSINRCLDAAGVKYAVLKGFALIPEYCPDASLRTTYDYDYLLPLESMERAQRALSVSGYIHKQEPVDHPVVYFHATRPPRIPSCREDLYSARLHRTVELHHRLWDADPVKIPLRLPEDPLDRIRLRSWQGLHFYSLCEEDELIFQVLHAFRHILHDWCRLCSFLEIAYFLQHRSLDSTFWERFSERIRCSRPLPEIVGVAFSLAADLFGAAIPASVSGETTQRLRRSLALWVDHYGRDSALNNFYGNKFSLFLHREFIQEQGAWWEVRRSRLFPLRWPNQAVQASSPRFSSRLAAVGLYILRRFMHHGLAALQYGWESPRWERLRVEGR